MWPQKNALCAATPANWLYLLIVPLIVCWYPIGGVHITVYGEWAARNSMAVEFLTNYYVPPNPLAQMEAYKMELDVECIDVTIAYLKENKDT